jgi:hypothetical protein
VDDALVDDTRDGRMQQLDVPDPLQKLWGGVQCPLDSALESDKIRMWITPALRSTPAQRAE